MDYIVKLDNEIVIRKNGQYVLSVSLFKKDGFVQSLKSAVTPIDIFAMRNIDNNDYAVIDRYEIHRMNKLYKFKPIEYNFENELLIDEEQYSKIVSAFENGILKIRMKSLKGIIKTL